MESPFCGPYILHDAFSLDGTTHFFIWEIFIFFRKDLESSLIFILFLNGKQNKKKNLKCGFLFGKDSLWKTKVGSGD